MENQTGPENKASQSDESEPFLADEAQGGSSSNSKGDTVKENMVYGEATHSNPEMECEKGRGTVFAVCIVTIIFCLAMIASTVSEFHNQQTNSSLVFLLEMVIDILSSSVVIWRFCPRDSALGDRRENIGQIFLGFLEAAMSIFGIVNCVYGLASHDGSHLTVSDDHLARAQIIFGVATGGFFLLTAAKFCLGCYFASLTLTADAIDSLAGCLMALAVVISQLVSEEENKKLWYFDHLTGLLMATAIGMFAVWLLYRRRAELKEDLHCDCCWSKRNSKLKK